MTDTYRRISDHSGEFFAGLKLVGSECDPAVAIAGDGFRSAVHAVNLRKILGHDAGPDAEPGHDRERIAEYLEVPELRKFVQHEQKRAFMGRDGPPVFEMKFGGQAVNDLVKNDSDHRFHPMAASIRNTQIKRYRLLVIHQILDLEIGALGRGCNQRIAID